MNSRLTLAAATLAVVALAGCTAPADTSAAPDTPGGDTPGETLAECLLGAWTLDAADLADQFRQQLIDTGLTVTAAQAAGEVTLDVTDGQMIYTSAVTFALTTALGRDGPEMVMTQAQDGVSRGSWAADGTTLRFSSWENGLTFTTTATIDGATADLPIELPAESFGGSESRVACAADTMTTTPEGGLFTTRWARIGDSRP